MVDASEHSKTSAYKFLSILNPVCVGTALAAAAPPPAMRRRNGRVCYTYTHLHTYHTHSGEAFGSFRTRRRAYDCHSRRQNGHSGFGNFARQLWQVVYLHGPWLHLSVGEVGL